MEPVPSTSTTSSSLLPYQRKGFKKIQLPSSDDDSDQESSPAPSASKVSSSVLTKSKPGAGRKRTRKSISSGQQSPVATSEATSESFLSISNSSSDEIITTANENLEVNDNLDEDYFSSTSLQKKPKKKKPNSEGRYVCPDCPERFKRQTYLLEHLRKHTGYQPVKCVYQSCNIEFRHLCSFRNHFKTQHGPIENAEVYMEVDDKILAKEEELLRKIVAEQEPIDWNVDEDEPPELDISRLCSEFQLLLKNEFPIEKAREYLEDISNIHSSEKEKDHYLYSYLYEDVFMDDVKSSTDWKTDVVARMLLFIRFLRLLIYLGKGKGYRAKAHLMRSVLSRENVSTHYILLHYKLTIIYSDTKSSIISPNFGPTKQGTNPNREKEACESRVGEGA